MIIIKIKKSYLRVIQIIPRSSRCRHSSPSLLRANKNFRVFLLQPADEFESRLLTKKFPFCPELYKEKKFMKKETYEKRNNSVLRNIQHIVEYC